MQRPGAWGDRAMVRSDDNASDRQGVVQPMPGNSADAIGRIRSLCGSVSVVRANGSVEQVDAGDTLCRGDLIETAADARVGIAFAGGTALNLSSGARMSLDEFACNNDGLLSSAL